MKKVYILRNEYYKTEDDIPRKATQDSSGYDIKSVSEPEIVGELSCDIEGVAYYKSIKYIQYHTGIYVNLDPEYKSIDSLIFPRSSISKYNLQLANSIGLCDNGYTGEYLARFNYLWQPEDLLVMNNSIVGRVNYDKIYKIGDKIAQLKYSNIIDVEFIYTDKLSLTERGSGGFGSTDNKVPNPIEERYKYVQQVSNTNRHINVECNVNTLSAIYADTYNLDTSEKYSDMIDKLNTTQQKGSNE